MGTRLTTFYSLYNIYNQSSCPALAKAAFAKPAVTPPRVNALAKNANAVHTTVISARKQTEQPASLTTHHGLPLPNLASILLSGPLSERAGGSTTDARKENVHLLT